MDLQALRQRCEGRLQKLELSYPFDVQQFCRAVERRRGRPIALCPVENRAGPYGAWVAGPTADYVFYERQTSPLHQVHIILHELCHLLCGHQPVSVADAALRELLFPDLSPASVRGVLQRGHGASDDDREAELLASLILERVATSQPADRPCLAPALAGLHRRLLASLGEEPEA
jgi:hypothetical protein